MKRREINIGNLIEHTDEETKGFVDEIYGREVFIENWSLGTTPISECIGVPITYDLLNAFETVSWLNDDGEKYYYFINSEKRFIDNFHTLQNLYYIVENKELQLKQV